MTKNLTASWPSSAARNYVSFGRLPTRLPNTLENDYDQQSRRRGSSLRSQLNISALREGTKCPSILRPRFVTQSWQHQRPALSTPQ